MAETKNKKTNTKNYSSKSWKERKKDWRSYQGRKNKDFRN